MYEINQIIKTKKPHVCGSLEWIIIRVGQDFKLKCSGCGRIILLSRYELDQRVKKN